MLLELSVSVKGKAVDEGSVNMSKIIDQSGLHYKTTGKGMVLEGSWEQLMAVAKKCHDEVLKTNDQFVTRMKAVDKKGCSGPSLQRAAANSLKKFSKTRASG